MNNNWSNSDTIKNKLHNQDCMIELNTINDKIIMIEDNECEVLDKKYINDKNNKIYWRNLWSFLDSESIEKITNYYYKDFMKNNILQIKPSIYFSCITDWKCRFITAKGGKCGKITLDNIELDKEYYTMSIGSSIECCGIHKNQYTRLSDKKKKDKIDEVFGSIGMAMKNGIMCKC
tara:strand:+ start:1652 stop:2179 length:528 start_codon:yes stop_codon:yes gene_type:complete